MTEEADPTPEERAERLRARHRALDAGARLTPADLRAMTRSTDIGMAPARAAAREILAFRGASRAAALEARRVERRLLLAAARAWGEDRGVNVRELLFRLQTWPRNL